MDALSIASPYRHCPLQCVDEATVEGLRTNRSQRIIRKTQSCFAHVNTVLHRRTRLLNCFFRCLRLTALVFCINKLRRSRCFHREHRRNCEKLALSTPRQAGIASGSWGTDCILGSKMYHRIHRLEICCNGKVPASPLPPFWYILKTTSA